MLVTVLMVICVQVLVLICVFRFGCECELTFMFGLMISLGVVLHVCVCEYVRSVCLHVLVTCISNASSF